MAANFSWLLEQLKDDTRLEFEEDGEILRIRKESEVYAVYCCGERYAVTTSNVQTVRSLGGNILVYAQRATAAEEAVEYGRVHGIRLVRYAELFKIIRR